MQDHGFQNAISNSNDQCVNALGVLSLFMIEIIQTQYCCRTRPLVPRSPRRAPAPTHPGCTHARQPACARRCPAGDAHAAPHLASRWQAAGNGSLPALSRAAGRPAGLHAVSALASRRAQRGTCARVGAAPTSAVLVWADRRDAAPEASRRDSAGAAAAGGVPAARPLTRPRPDFRRLRCAGRFCHPDSDG